MRAEIKKLSREHREWVYNLLTERWGSTKIVTRGKVHEADTLPGFVALVDGEPAGVITYHISGKELEVTSLDALIENQGIATSLLKKVQGFAVAHASQRVFLITTNDNTKALRFYQKRGFHIAAFHRNASEYSRKLKPEIPEIGNDEIPIRDEIELEIRLD